MNLFGRILFLLITTLPLATDAANSAMAIDLGSEFLKLALIKPGVPMETVLPRDSRRKAPMALTIQDSERHMGDAALKKAISRPRHTFTSFLGLVGKQLNDSLVTAYQNEHPHIQLTAHPARGTVQFASDVGALPVETALGMLLWNARQEVEAYAGQPVRDAVITVPSYFGALERAAVEAAARVADLNLLQLLGSGTAAGLNYGVFRHKEITEKPQTLLIYDVGSTKTLATVVQFRLVNETSGEGKKATTTSFPQMETIGVGYDQGLGGRHLTLRLRDHLAAAFRKQHPQASGDIAQNPQAMAKLLKEADRVKQVLSANPEHFAHIESVFEDRDFRTKVTRDELEAMFRDFESRYMEPINDALRMAQLSVDQLDRVVLMGAGTRVPRLQTILAAFLKGKELSRQLNTDEAIALGAVYQAARLTKGFKVKRFEVRELIPPEVDLSATEPPSFTKWLTSLTTDDAALQANMSTVMTDGEIKEAKKILAQFEKKEKAKAERAAALHSLESAVYDYSDKLEETEFSKFGTEEELKQIRQRLGEMREWLEDMPEETEAEAMKQKRRDLMSPIRKLKNRKRQKEERPALMDKLNATLEEAEKKLQMFNGSKDFFTEGELDTFGKLIGSVKSWLETIKKELDQLQDNQDASFHMDDLKSKATTLDRESKFLFNRLIIELRRREEAEREARRLKEEMEAAAARANATKNATEEETAAKVEEGEKKTEEEIVEKEEEGEKKTEGGESVVKEEEAAEKKTEEESVGKEEEAAEKKKEDDEAEEEKKKKSADEL